MPQKPILRGIANTCLAFTIDGYGTSEQCPGMCGNALSNTGVYRMKKCTSAASGDGSPCPLSKYGVDGHFQCDRDSVATLNMTLCVRAVLGLQVASPPLQTAQAIKFPTGELGL